MEKTMTDLDIIKIVGSVAGTVMPLFNIPLILKIIKRKSSKDISLTWTLGVWSCIILMTPSAILSADLVFKLFGIVNLVFFSAVVFFVIKYRKE